jgi:hypothetical protein
LIAPPPSPLHLFLRFRYAASLGFPLIIDLLDCDVLLPSPYGSPEEVVLPGGGEERPYLYMSELLKLSILLGRITKVRRCLSQEGYEPVC